MEGKENRRIVGEKSKRISLQEREGVEKQKGSTKKSVEVLEQLKSKVAVQGSSGEAKQAERQVLFCFFSPSNG